MPRSESEIEKRQSESVRQHPATRRRGRADSISSCDHQMRRPAPTSFSVPWCALGLRGYVPDWNCRLHA